VSRWGIRPRSPRKGPITCCVCGRQHGYRWGWPCQLEKGDRASSSSSERRGVNGSAGDSRGPASNTRSVPAGSVQWGSDALMRWWSEQRSRTPFDHGVSMVGLGSWLPQVSGSPSGARRRNGYQGKKWRKKRRGAYLFRARIMEGGPYVCDFCGQRFEVSDKRNACSHTPATQTATS
jgi:hypothetical protein